MFTFAIVMVSLASLMVLSSILLLIGLSGVNIFIASDLNFQRRKMKIKYLFMLGPKKVVYSLDSYNDINNYV